MRAHARLLIVLLVAAAALFAFRALPKVFLVPADQAGDLVAGKHAIALARRKLDPTWEQTGRDFGDLGDRSAGATMQRYSLSNRRESVDFTVTKSRARWMLQDEERTVIVVTSDFYFKLRDGKCMLGQRARWHGVEGFCSLLSEKEWSELFDDIYDAARKYQDWRLQ